MQPPSDISQERIDQYNLLYNQALKMLGGLIFLQDRPRSSIGWFRKRRIRRAIDMLKACVEVVPKAWPCMWNIGKAYQAIGDHHAALAWFEKAADINKENADVFREACLEAMNLGLAKKALGHAVTATRLCPREAGLHANHALALLIAGQGSQALAVAEKALEINPADPVNKNVVKYVETVVAGAVPYPNRIPL